MKKRYIVFGLLSLYQPLKGQVADTSFEKKKLKKTDIELTMAYYRQDGNNSAVTGGQGTEKLSVYSPSLKITHQFKKLNTYTFSGGADVVSSASTDNIDFIVSSASKRDTHFYLNSGYTRKLKHTDLSIGGTAGMAIESDYLAFPLSLSLNYTEPSKMRSYEFSFNSSIDDLRWQRINSTKNKPKKIIYPSELRYKDWYDTHKRYTFGFQFGFTQVITKRLVGGFFPGLIYQQGLLATPFHRVFFTDNTLRVENLPKQRFRFPLGVKLNAFIGNHVILKNQYSFYADNFGIIGNAVEMEAVIKILQQFSMSAFFRFYHQSGSDYFKAYKEHLPEEEFYSSDYDLSTFNTYKAGGSVKFSPVGKGRKYSFADFVLRYAFFYRSNQLQSHMISMAVHVSYEHKNKGQ